MKRKCLMAESTMIYLMMLSKCKNLQIFQRTDQIGQGTIIV